MILSIESSCDDSSLAITEITNAKLLFHQKISQDNIHSRYGGVVPEIASRLHTQSLPTILKQAKEFLGDFSKLKAIAVTTEPGLSVSLIEGLMMAKILALSLQIPLLSINHLIGHFYSLFINQQQAIFPMSVLLVSGGHTQILRAHDPAHFEIIAQSSDDSFGESFDKVAKMLGLGYPGGPIIESYAKQYPKHLTLAPLPLPLKNKQSLGFSFSGLKNATRLLIESLENKHISHHIDSIQTTIPKKSNSTYTESKNAQKLQFVCASFQQAAIAHICNQIERYFKQSVSGKRVLDFAIVGGASSNLALRSAIETLCHTFGARLHLAPLEFCTDNAAMIGRAGIAEYQARHFMDIERLDISPRSTTKLLYQANTIY